MCVCVQEVVCRNTIGHSQWCMVHVSDRCCQFLLVGDGLLHVAFNKLHFLIFPFDDQSTPFDYVMT